MDKAEENTDEAAVGSPPICRFSLPFPQKRGRRKTFVSQRPRTVWFPAQGDGLAVAALRHTGDDNCGLRRGGLILGPCLCCGLRLRLPDGVKRHVVFQGQERPRRQVRVFCAAVRRPARKDEAGPGLKRTSMPPARRQAFTNWSHSPLPSSQWSSAQATAETGGKALRFEGRKAPGFLL